MPRPADDTVISMRRRGDADPDVGSAEVPEWPPRAGTKVGLYLPEGADPDHEYLVEVDDLHRPRAAGEATEDQILAVTAPTGVVIDTGGPPTPAKLLFPGPQLGWGYDAEVVAVDPGSRPAWRLRIVCGPVPVERRDSQRVPHRAIVLIRRAGKVIPAHMLDRSDHGMRCIAGRGARIGTGEKVDIGIDVAANDIIDGAIVAWRRMTDSGLEFGLSF